MGLFSWPRLQVSQDPTHKRLKPDGAAAQASKKRTGFVAAGDLTEAVIEVNGGR